MVELKTYTYRMLATIILLAVAVVVRAELYNGYVSNNEMPNPLSFLPLPPDSASTVFAGDYASWVWGKSMRCTPRGEQASWESRSGIVRMCTIYSDVLGIDITEDNTPAIYRLMYRAGCTGANSVATMKSPPYRKHPFQLVNEPTWGQFDNQEELEAKSSYPSSSMAFCWSTALALAEMAPHMQDTILRRGIEYGISSVITGAYWQSDIDAAINCSSVAMTKAHSSQEFLADIESAREEYILTKGLSLNEITSGYPIISKILDSPPDATSYHFASDVAQYWHDKPLRETERGTQALADDSLLDDYFMGIVDSCSEINISESETPHIALLIKTVKLMLSTNATTLKQTMFRKRPFLHMGERLIYMSPAWKVYRESSYPSRHAMIGWGVALVLSEVMPECQESLLNRLREYGNSRIVLGLCYASDVQASRVMASCALVKMHNTQLFNTLLENAKKEYQQKKTD